MNRHLSAHAVVRMRIAALLLATASLAGCGILPKQETLALYRPEPAIAADAAPWSPAPLTPAIARTEGWTFSII